MRFGFRGGFRTVNTIVFFMFVSLACRGQSEDFLVGARGGLSFNTGIKRFQQVEAFGEWKLWHWGIYSDLFVRPYLDISAGDLWNEKEEGFAGTLGPGVELHAGKFPVVLEGGSSPTLLSRDNFGGENFGYKFQFTSHIGLRWEITKHFSVDVRFQHMSNAGIAKPNPGLNMQMFSASYGF